MAKVGAEHGKPGHGQSGGSVRVGPLAGLPALVRALDCDPEPLILSAGFDPAELKDPDRVISFVAASQLLSRCVAATGCEHLGLLLGERSAPSSLGLPGFMLRTAPDVGSALRSLLRHLDLHDQGGVPILDVRGGVAMLGYAIQQQRAEARDQIYDLSVVMACNIMRGLCGADWNPTEVLLARPAPPDPRPYKHFFRAPLSFDAEQSAIVFASTWLDHRIPDADPALHRHLQREAEDLHRQRGADLVTELRYLLRRLLVTNQCSAAQAATQLCMHERTLNRRLRERGTSFQRELDSIRYDLARHFLAETSMPLATIAEALAYADTTAFSRAFRRWSGATPAQWRGGKPKG